MIARRQKPEELIPYNARFYESQWKRMLAFKEEADVDLMAQIRGGVDMYLEARGETQARPKENQIAIELSPPVMSALKKLSDDVLHIDDVEVFVESLTKAAISAGPEAVYKLIYSRFDSATAKTKMKDEQANTPAKQARKAA